MRQRAIGCAVVVAGLLAGIAAPPLTPGGSGPILAPAIGVPSPTAPARRSRDEPPSLPCRARVQENTPILDDLTLPPARLDPETWPPALWPGPGGGGVEDPQTPARQWQIIPRTWTPFHLPGDPGLLDTDPDAVPGDDPSLTPEPLPDPEPKPAPEPPLPGLPAPAPDPRSLLT